MTNTRRASILTNSFWYGLETGLDIVIGVASSIAIARALGPERLGHFVFLTFLTNSVVGRLGVEGTGTAARKYISEHLARGETHLVRSVFFTTLRIQAALALTIVVIGGAAAWWFTDPAYRITACLLVFAIAPSLVTNVPSQANMAAERFGDNVPSAIAGLLAYAGMIVGTLMLGWGVVGLAAALLVRRLVEMVIRFIPVLKWMRSLPRIAPPKALRRALFSFSGQSLAITIMTLIVWDRSEVLFLKAFCNIKQLAYYSIAFNLAGYTLLLPNVFGTAASANIMAEYARSKERAAAVASKALRYLALMIFPINCGLAVLSGAAIRIAYGSLYTAAIPAIAIAAVLAIPKGFYSIPYTLHLAADRQNVVLRWLAITAVLNIGLDAVLIPRYGANGAAIANGTAQAFAALVLLSSARKLCPMRLNRRGLRQIGTAALIMSSVALAIVTVCSGVTGVVLSVLSGPLVYCGCLRITGAISLSDVDAVTQGLNRFPLTRGRLIRGLLVWVAGTAAG